MARRTLYLPLMVAVAVLLACVAAVATLLAVSKEAESTFPGKNGKIAFVSTRDTKTESGEIYTMNPNGTSVERLTNSPKADLEPAWSPDGNRIAFARDRHGMKPCRLLFSCYEIYTMNPNGQALERLTNNRAADFDPDWQPLSPPDNWPFKVKGSA
jgi:Tol biopolymer transport system component